MLQVCKVSNQLPAQIYFLRDSRHALHHPPPPISLGKREVVGTSRQCPTHSFYTLPRTSVDTALCFCAGCTKNSPG